jgi:hypothetical protein
MTGRHHRASTLLRHVAAALPFRGSHCRTWKDARHGRRDCPEQGNRQQRESSDSSHSHQCTAFSDYRERTLTSSDDVRSHRRRTTVTGITSLGTMRKPATPVMKSNTISRSREYPISLYFRLSLIVKIAQNAIFDSEKGEGQGSQHSRQESIVGRVSLAQRGRFLRRETVRKSHYVMANLPEILATSIHDRTA